MGLKEKILEKGVFVKFRIGKKPFNPAFPEKERTTVWQDVSKKRKEKEDGKNNARIVDCGVIVPLGDGAGNNP